MKISRIIDYIESKFMNPIKYARKKGVSIADNCWIVGGPSWGSEPWLISIGDKTTISSGVRFYTHDGSVYVARNLDGKYSHVSKIGKIEIGNNCFIGAFASIMPNIRIGNNCIVGTGSVVTKDIPDNEVWGGYPPRESVLFSSMLRNYFKIHQNMIISI